MLALCMFLAKIFLHSKEENSAALNASDKTLTYPYILGFKKKKKQYTPKTDLATYELIFTLNAVKNV